MKAMMSAEYKTFFKEIKERIHKAQYDAFKSVNKELINLYWDIGRSIVAKQEKLGWGKSIVETLARDLQKEFPGIQGFSVQNLWNMRQFYSAYKGNPKLQPMVGEISWTKNVIIMQRCKDDIQREFYIKITKKFGWTKDVLINQLEAGAFKPEYAGKMQFYLSALNDRAKLPDENPSIGIILCKGR
jgi:predicted nuclease of restriction endonuclease-like (RecB) superfamily